eukprot:2443015-Prymnesium_polylepis.1
MAAQLEGLDRGPAARANHCQLRAGVLRRCCGGAAAAPGARAPAGIADAARARALADQLHLARA